MFNQSRLAANEEEKRAICRHAASLIEPNDFVYIDGGGTPQGIADFLEGVNARFVTCSIKIAKRLTHRGKDVLLLGGHYDEISEMIVGPEAVQMLHNYNFTKGFFSVTGITRHAGCTSIYSAVAAIKQQAIAQCLVPYILASPSKFGVVCAVTFADFDAVRIITTTSVDPRFQSCTNVIQVRQD